MLSDFIGYTNNGLLSIRKGIEWYVARSLFRDEGIPTV